MDKYSFLKQLIRDGTIEIYINMNDVFVPAADNEEIEHNELDEVLNILDKDGYDKAIDWVKKKRDKQ